MREFQTARFGLVRYDESEVIHFPVGIPGFESETKFLLIENEASRPLCFLQSIQNAELCFVCAPVELVDNRYEAQLGKADREILQAGEEDDASNLRWVAILCFVQPDAPTANLLGPIVLRLDRKLGVQAIREDNLYSARQPLFGEVS